MGLYDSYIRPWVSVAKGSMATFRQMLSPTITRLYPVEPAEISRRWRGPLRLRGVMDDLEAPVTDAPPLEFNELMTTLHEQQRVAPCMGGCPANVDARGQNALVAEGRDVEAYNVVRRRNILPGVLGYICNNPCEDVCRRSYLDDPIAIRQLHRHCYEVYDREVRRPGHLPSLVTRPEHVAIIGAGPAGLAVGYDLIQMGYRATIYDRNSVPGGLLATSVPLYRLDREVVYKEIHDLEEMGLEIKLNVNVGQDVSLAELRKNHDAVVIAVGYSGGRILPLPGVEAEGVWSAIDFLYAYTMGQECQVGPRVVVFGGGDVAADCSRSALRCGATESIQVFRDPRHEMPGQEIEVRGAIEDGVVLMDMWGPEEVLTENGRVSGVRIRKLLRHKDETGRVNPIYSDETKVIPCDSVIFAVGQTLQIDFLKGSGIQLDPYGRPVVDQWTGACNLDGVFFAGDIVTGPLTVIIAMGQGHETAISVDRYLRKESLTADRVPPVHPPEYYLKKMYAPSPPQFFGPGGHRVHMPESDPIGRLKTGEQVELGWPKGEGQRESVRCMRCQTHVCVACTMCARVCPDNCIDVRGYDTGYTRIVTKYDFVMEWCCFCGLCEDICPTQTLSLAPSFDYSSHSRKAFVYDREYMLRPFREPDELYDRDGWP